MLPCILHIGAGKCGSSSLQTELSRSPVIISRSGVRYEYMALRRDGTLKRGAWCSNESAKSTFGYTSSASVKEFFSEETRPKLIADLKRVEREGVVPVFSFEGWINETARFAEWEVFGTLGLAPHVIAFVRPQVPWINSSWWQWGAWKGKDFHVWLERYRRNGLWAHAAGRWKNLSGVRDVTILPTSGDVVDRFFDFLDAERSERKAGKKSNVTLDGSILRLFQQYRKLRADELGSGIDFVLQRNRVVGVGAAPWVLEPELITELLAFYRKDNEALLELVDTSIREEILGDPQWWDAEAYSRKKAESPAPQDLDAEQTGEIAIKAILALAKMEKKMRRGRS